MKKIAFLFFVLPCLSIAQSLTPEVISSSGNTFTDGTSQLDWTMGETVTADFTAGSDQLTQGFHQPELLATVINDIAAINVSVYPNPVLMDLNISIEDINDATIELYSIEGKLLASAKPVGKTSQLNMSQFAAGNYILKVSNNKNIASYKITKTN